MLLLPSVVCLVRRGHHQPTPHATARPLYAHRAPTLCRAQGVDIGFISTTEDRTQALRYASQRTPSIIMEIAQGMVDRGADLSWLSQV